MVGAFSFSFSLESLFSFSYTFSSVLSFVFLSLLALLIRMQSRRIRINKIYIINPTAVAELLQYSGLGSNTGMGFLRERRFTVD